MSRWIVIGALLLSCGGRSAPLPPSSTSDAGPGFVPPCDLDLLLVIDDSTSMGEEQAALAAALAGLLRGLDARAPRLAPRSVQVGVVSTDLGSRDVTVPTCDTDGGRNAELTTSGSSVLEGCLPDYPRFLRYTPGAVGNAPEAFATELSCLTTLGNAGCGFEQPFEAALMALTPSTSSLRFAGQVGHGDGANAGFLRDESILAVVMLTDEDDCSVADAELFDPASPRFDPHLNLRCSSYPEALHPISRYVDGFSALRAAHPERLLVASIAGVPVDLAAAPSDFDAARILEDPRMQQRVDPEDEDQLIPVCRVPELGEPNPGRRIVQLAAGLGERGLVQSICQPDLSAPIATLLQAIEERVRPGCGDR